MLTHNSAGHCAKTRHQLTQPLIIPMTFDICTALPTLLPKAIAWAQNCSTLIAQTGYPLDEKLAAVARRVGVAHPEHIRLLEAESFPLPDDPELKQAALAVDLLGPDMLGLTLGYGVYIRRGYRSLRLLSHEFRHVHQYETAGSIAEFLPAYLQQIATLGYSDAPFEVDARAHEIRAFL